MLRSRIAHLASPWLWKARNFRLLGVALVVGTAWTLFREAARPNGWQGKTISLGWELAVAFLVFLRPYVRSLRRRRKIEAAGSGNPATHAPTSARPGG